MVQALKSRERWSDGHHELVPGFFGKDAQNLSLYSVTYLRYKSNDGKEKRQAKQGLICFNEYILSRTCLFSTKGWEGL